MNVFRVRTGVAFAALVALLSGCGKSSETGGASGGGGTPTGKEGITALAELLKDFDARKVKPPGRLADIEPVEPAFPAAYIGLVRGDILYAWGNGINAAASGTVLAHEKSADASGGWVLLQNGDVKQMSAEEFKSAPKAKK